MSVGGEVADARGHEFLDGFNGLNPASGSGRGAIQGGSGAGEVELALDRPVLQETVDEAGVEDVSGPGGVNYGHRVGRQLVQLSAIPGQYAIVPQGGCGEAASVATLHLAQ